MRRGVKSSMTLLIFLSGRNESLVSIFTHRNAQQLAMCRLAHLDALIL